MDHFVNKADAERQIFFEEAANRQGVTPLIIEKDFWVCWTLKRLYQCPDLGPYLTFKGGTSLSKRLSEKFKQERVA
jgi:predicted nucleotidyltransferase component of viral defense system